jgi:hypothetical protein
LIGSLFNKFHTPLAVPVHLWGTDISITHNCWLTNSHFPDAKTVQIPSGWTDTLL